MFKTLKYDFSHKLEFPNERLINRSRELHKQRTLTLV